MNDNTVQPCPIGDKSPAPVAHSRCMLSKRLTRVSLDFIHCYIPLVPDVSDPSSWVQPRKGCTLLETKIRGSRADKARSVGKYLSERFVSGYKKILSKSLLRLKESTIDRFLSLPISQIHQLEGCINGVVDALLLSVPELFDGTARNHATVCRLMRSIIANGVNLGYESIIRRWKEFTNYVWLTVSRTVGSMPPSINRCNFFYSILLRVNQISLWMSHGICDKRDAELISHLISTRQMPCGGIRAQKKALYKFIDTVSRPFPVTDWTVDAMYHASKDVGTRVLNYLNRKLPSEVTHISLASAGDYDVTSAEGGRGAAILKDLREFYTVVPEEDKIHQLPLGYTGKDVAGKPRWLTWMRFHEPWYPASAPFAGLVKDPFEVFPVADRRYGLDEAVGYQIFALALIRAKEWGLFDADNDLVYDYPPIPARTAAVPEPGGKTRIVTVTKWWAIILQQPVGHFFRKCLEAHPFAVGGLGRADQGWLYIDQLAGLDDRGLDLAILSSDLSEATDTIDHRIAQALVSGFSEALGLNPSPLTLLGLALVTGPRLFEVNVPSASPVIVRKERGVMMGEPFAKAILTLLNLAIEEEAFQYATQGSVSEDHLPTKPWRKVSIVGDDHAAVGPLPYLNRLTDNHKRCGSKIAPDKHGLSKTCVKFCERIIYFRNRNFHPVSKIIADYNVYLESVAVDSLKVRLLSPYSRSVEVCEEANPAIGKGFAIGRNLEFLNKVSFTPAWKQMVIERFFARMGHYLPAGKRLLHLKLPTFLGGLGLSTWSEVLADYQELPYLSRVLVCRASLGDLSPGEVSSARSLTAVQAVRGYKVPVCGTLDLIRKVGLQAAAKQLDLPIPKKEVVSTVCAQLGIEGNMKQKLKRLREAGWMEQRDVEEQLLRASIFESVLSASTDCEVQRYTSDPWGQRFNKLYKEVGGGKHPALDTLPDEQGLHLIESATFGALEIFNMGSARRLTRIVDLSNNKLVPRMLSFFDLALKGTPTLRLPNILKFPCIDLPTWMRSTGRNVVIGGPGFYRNPDATPNQDDIVFKLARSFGF